MKQCNKQIFIKSAWLLMLCVMCLRPERAAAVDAITQALCNLNLMVTGTIGKAVVMVVIISTGFGMFFGKITWVTALIILVGVGLVFGGPALVSTLTGGPALTCSSGTVA